MNSLKHRLKTQSDVYVATIENSFWVRAEEFRRVEDHIESEVGDVEDDET